MSDEKLTVTTKIPGIETDVVFIVIAMEGQFEFVETKAGSILSISFCFFQLADQSVIHLFISFRDLPIRHFQALAANGIEIKKARE